MSAYGHAGRIDVRRGQAVKAGDVVGLSGATGQVQTPQLHFQLRKNRLPVDPMKQLPPRQPAMPRRFSKNVQRPFDVLSRTPRWPVWAALGPRLGGPSLAPVKP